MMAARTPMTTPTMRPVWLVLGCLWAWFPLLPPCVPLLLPPDDDLRFVFLLKMVPRAEEEKPPSGAVLAVTFLLP